MAARQRGRGEGGGADVIDHPWMYATSFTFESSFCALFFASFLGAGPGVF